MKKTIIYSKDNFTELEKEILEALQKYGYKDILESYKTIDPEIDLQGIVTGFLNAFMEKTSKDSILTLDTQLLRVFKVKEGEVELTISNDLKDLFPKVIKSIDLDQEFYLGKIQDPKDRKLLENYVTSVDGNIYALKNLPEEVIAVIMAYVSRSPNTFKENLLTSLKDEDIIADNVSSALDKTSDKAQKFHEKWVLAYGHGSVSELAHVSICMDAVSILASKQIEDNRLASYCEKSTRYQKFESNHAYHIPDELKDDHIRMYCDLMDYTFMIYNNLFTPVKKELKVLYPKADKVSEKAYENSIHAKACDILRYLLPTSTYTSLALKFNGRTAAHAISKLKSHVLKESQEIGMLLKNEAIKVLPTLVKYADKNAFRVGLPLLRSKFTQGLKLPTNNINCSKIVSTSVDYQGLLNTLVTNILYPESNVSFEDLKTFVKMDLSQNYKKSLILEYVNSRGKFNSLPRVFETINLQVEMLSDYGAYRDLQRHRLCTPIDTLLSPELGFSLHPDTERLSFDIQQSIANVLIYQKHLYQDFIDAGVSKEVCQYLLSMAWNIKYSRVFNLRDLVNMLELRSGKQGHVSYRKISLDLGKDLISKFPIMQDILRLDETPLTSLERIESESKHNK